MFDFLRNLRKTADERQQETITAYLDNALTPQEQQRFEQTLAQNPALQTQLEAERRLKTQLQTLPRRRVPRHFTLDPALYGRPQPQLLLQLYPVLRAATVLNAVVLIVILVAGSFSSNTLSAPPFSSAEQSQIAAEAAPAQSDSANSITAGESMVEATEVVAVQTVVTEIVAEEPAAEPAEDVVEESVAEGGVAMDMVTAVSSQEIEGELTTTIVQTTAVIPLATVVATIQAPGIIAATATVSALPRPETTPTPDTTLRNSTEEPPPQEVAENVPPPAPETNQPTDTFFAVPSTPWLLPAFLFITWVILLVATLYVRRRVR